MARPAWLDYPLFVNFVEHSNRTVIEALGFRVGLLEKLRVSHNNVSCNPENQEF
jgi:hypothetical protein